MVNQCIFKIDDIFFKIGLACFHAFKGLCCFYFPIFFMVLLLILISDQRNHHPCCTIDFKLGMIFPDTVG